MIFYHATTAELAEGDMLEPGNRGYVCLARSIAHAKYWQKLLALGDTCRILEVSVPDDEIVLNVRSGYRFEWGSGPEWPESTYQHPLWEAAGDLTWSPEAETDSEVCVDRPVKVVGCV
jgi:hypothetical protein